MDYSLNSSLALAKFASSPPPPNKTAMVSPLGMIQYLWNTGPVFQTRRIPWNPFVPHKFCPVSYVDKYLCRCPVHKLWLISFNILRAEVSRIGQMLVLFYAFAIIWYRDSVFDFLRKLFILFSWNPIPCEARKHAPFPDDFWYHFATLEWTKFFRKNRVLAFLPYNTLVQSSNLENRPRNEREEWLSGR